MNSKKTRKIEIGDVFATPLPLEKYGAIKIIDIIDNSYLIAITTYINEQIPTLNSKEVHEVLISESLIDDSQEPLYEWVEGRIPKDLIFIGNAPLTKNEIGVKSNIYAGKWSRDCGIAVYYKWREETDPKGFELEMKRKIEKADSYAKKEHVPKPKKMMEDKEFWDIISLFDWNKNSEEEIIEPAVKKLATLTIWKIKHFEETLTCKLFLLDTLEHAKEIGKHSFSEQSQNFSPDLFLYARCAAVAYGQKVFEDVLSDPQKMIKDTEFESILSVAPKAYYLKKGTEFDYISGYSYETFSNKYGWSKET